MRDRRRQELEDWGIQAPSEVYGMPVEWPLDGIPSGRILFAFLQAEGSHHYMVHGDNWIPRSFRSVDPATLRDELQGKGLTGPEINIMLSWSDGGVDGPAVSEYNPAGKVAQELRLHHEDPSGVTLEQGLVMLDGPLGYDKDPELLTGPCHRIIAVDMRRPQHVLEAAFSEYLSDLFREYGSPRTVKQGKPTVQEPDWKALHRALCLHWLREQILAGTGTVNAGDVSETLPGVFPALANTSLRTVQDALVRVQRIIDALPVLFPGLKK